MRCGYKAVRLLTEIRDLLKPRRSSATKEPFVTPFFNNSLNNLNGPNYSAYGEDYSKTSMHYVLEHHEKQNTEQR